MISDISPLKTPWRGDISRYIPSIWELFHNLCIYLRTNKNKCKLKDWGKMESFVKTTALQVLWNCSHSRKVENWIHSRDSFSYLFYVSSWQIRALRKLCKCFNNRRWPWPRFLGRLRKMPCWRLWLASAVTHGPPSLRNTFPRTALTERYTPALMMQSNSNGPSWKSKVLPFVPFPVPHFCVDV